MKRARFLAGVAVVCGLVSTSMANVVFSNVTIQGSLSAGASFNTSPTGIDFLVPAAVVGDGFATRSGNVLITYEAVSDTPLTFDNLGLTGILDGLGQIFVNEVVEDLSAPSILATHNAVLFAPNGLPYNATLSFSQATTHFKVKKTFFMSALDSAGFDRAAIRIISQDVPEPISAVLLGLGGVVFARRRR